MCVFVVVVFCILRLLNGVAVVFGIIVFVTTAIISGAVVFVVVPLLVCCSVFVLFNF